ncbi:MAG: ABC transporter substrate-binding protein [Chloroflexi bacterium]|nr:ABC transporter substrate-binding protein [Chloroflexota bacterium]
MAVIDDEGRLFASAVRRRSLLRGAALGGAGLAAAALLGCGGDDDDAASNATPAKPSPSASATVATTGELIKDDALPYPYQYPEPNKKPKAGGIMVFGVNSDISTMDTTKATSSGTGRIVNMVYNRLIGFNRGVRLHPFKISYEPELAKSWERSPDGLTYTFNLREDVKWQNVAPLNGRAFEAADVKFAYERFAKEGVSRQYWTELDKVEALDKKTVKITLKKPLADFMTPLASAYQTIFPKELVDSGELEKKAIGTGPMILKEAISAQRVTFEKNPSYWERPVLLDGFEFRFIADSAARIAAFRSEQIAFGDILVSSIQDAKQLVASNPTVQINMSPSVASQPFAMNLSNPKFADVRVRRAISMAIDRQEFVNIVYPGLGKALPFLPWIFALDKEPKSTELGSWAQYNVEEAKKLLIAAGAEKLELNNKYYAYSPAYDQLAEVHAAQFKKAGIELKGGKAEYTEFNSQWVGGKLPEVSTGGWPTIGFDADNYFYACLHSKSPGNRWQLKDPKLDELAEKGRLELDSQKRKAIFKQIWDYDLDQAYHPVVASGSGFNVLQPWVRGMRFGGALSTTNSYQDIGDIVAEAWIDK